MLGMVVVVYEMKKKVSVGREDCVVSYYLRLWTWREIR
jgi:hypothetical protein